MIESTGVIMREASQEDVLAIMALSVANKHELGAT
jgi:hypothetical protein